MQVAYFARYAGIFLTLAPTGSFVLFTTLSSNIKAVIRFCGLVGEKRRVAEKAELMIWLDSKGITPIGQPEIAHYNPP